MDENGARVSSENLSTELQGSQQVHGKGQQRDVPVDHAKLIQIHNLKPRSGYGTIPVQSRLHLAIDDREESRTIPALLQQSFKDIKGTTTYFMKAIG